MEPIIGDDTYVDPVAWLDGGARGLIPRDMTAFPRGCYASAAAVDIPLIPRSEWSERIKLMELDRSRLSDIRLVGDAGNPIPSLDQNGQGYCWAYAVGHCVTIMRAVAGLPYVPLSPHAVACKIKGFRDEGGWSALALDFVSEKGIPAQSVWPAQSMRREYDTPATWENAKLHRVTEGWVDLQSPVHDRDLSFDQVMTCLLSRIPVAADLMWWGHAVCLLDPVETSPGKFGVRCWNSWGDSWGDKGMGVLAGSKAIPDNAVAPRVVTASVS